MQFRSIIRELIITANFRMIGGDAIERIIEIVSGNVTSTRQFVWSGNTRSEERDSMGSLTIQYLGQGERVSSTAYFYTKDHIASTREMTDAAGPRRHSTRIRISGRLQRLQEAAAAIFASQGCLRICEVG